MELSAKPERSSDEIEALGGMAKAIESGMPKMRIEESAARSQARIDQGKDVIVGVNKYKMEEETPLRMFVKFRMRSAMNRLQRLKEIKAKRNAAAVEKALDAHHPLRGSRRQSAGSLHCRGPGKGNGRRNFRCHGKSIRAICGHHPVYFRCLCIGIWDNQPSLNPYENDCQDFAEKEGRRPRILVTKMGQDGHDRGIKVVATAFADLGFDVDISPMFQTPEEAAKMAVENDVHVVGVSSLAAGHKILVPAADRRT